MTLKCLVSFPVAPVLSALPQVSLLCTVGKRVDQSLKLLPFSVNRFLRCIPPASRVNSFSTRSQVLYHGHGHKRSRRGSIQTLKNLIVKGLNRVKHTSLPKEHLSEPTLNCVSCATCTRRVVEHQ